MIFHKHILGLLSVDLMLIDAVVCLYFYLMKPDGASGDAFVKEGFSNWKKKERLQTRVRNHGSAHNQARRKCEAFMKQK
ncbi:hypothetical protein AHAS_Ahas20G0023100 [Arachis hypogaea]